MQTNLTPKLVILECKLSVFRLGVYALQAKDTCQQLLNFVTCGQVWFQVVSFHPSSAFCSLENRGLWTNTNWYGTLWPLWGTALTLKKMIFISAPTATSVRIHSF